MNLILVTKYKQNTNYKNTSISGYVQLDVPTFRLAGDSEIIDFSVGSLEYSLTIGVASHNWPEQGRIPVVTYKIFFSGK